MNAGIAAGLLLAALIAGAYVVVNMKKKGAYGNSGVAEREGVP